MTSVAPFHYVIGHGLYFSPSVWEELTGFPEDELNEDAFWGLQLALAGIRVVAIPYLQQSSPPHKISVYIKQQAAWYFGPMRAWSYFRKLRLGSVGRHADRPKSTNCIGKALLSTIQLWCHAIYWLAGPIVILLFIPALILFYGAYSLAVVWVLLTLWFCWGMHILCWAFLRRLGEQNERPGGPLSSIIAYALHAVGPLLAIEKTIVGRNTQQYKYKTEKRRDKTTNC